MKVGSNLPSLHQKAEPSAMATLAVILRDPNPIHLDPQAAAAAGLGNRVINQGPANLAYIINMLKAALPDHRLVEIDSRYLSNVRGDDVVEAGGSVTATSANEIECDTWLKLEDGTMAVTARARLRRRD
jgi:3-hydroxybutyryl-CoA dehydratase